MADSSRILEKFNNEKFLGKFAGEERRNPTSITQNTAGPYTVKQLVYPEDLSVRSDLQHYIVFYINARGKTKFKNEKTVNVDVSTKGKNQLSQQGLATTASVLSGVAVGGATAGGIFNAVREKMGDQLRLFSRGTAIAAAGGAAAGVVAGGTMTYLQQFSDTFAVKEPERVTDAIMLPIQSLPSVSYKVKYKTFDFGTIAGLLGGSSAVDSTAVGRLGESVAKILASMGSVAAAAGFKFGETAVEAAKLAGKVATNPFREVLFESVDYRNFSFNYTFLPKSRAEVYNVRRIIDLFKFHMHPELSKDGLFYVYPSEFEMQYYFKGQQNSFMHKMSTCVLTGMDVVYGDQYFSSFDDGSPVEIKLTLNFQETELLTKERIVKGY